MSDFSSSLKEQLTVLRAGANTAVTAGGTGDNTEIVGTTFDLQALGYPKRVCIAISFTATLAAGKKLTIKNLAFEHSTASNMAGGADLYAPADVVAALDSGSGSTLTGCVTYAADISGANRYVRITYTPDEDASGTDTANVGAVLIFGNTQIAPTTQPAAA